MKRLILETLALALIAVPPAVETWLVAQRPIPAHHQELFGQSFPTEVNGPVSSPEIEPPVAGNELTWEMLRDSGMPVLWIDARVDHVFAEGHYPGSINLNQQNWDRNLSRVLKRRRPGGRIVVYCGGPQCGLSRAIAERLRKEAGLADVYTLPGGWPVLKQHVP